MNDKGLKNIMYMKHCQVLHLIQLLCLGLNPPHHYCMSLAEKILPSYGFAPQRFPRRNDNETGPSNTHIIDTEHG
ncbi:hypothetical protein DEO72_LG3g561 [Vigna unguiculata]|uniref:Uncharacterized protein n=1 Tax=Vigna unguiculata TaxID=3917 RepID=A0A4D6LC36_VIGUN|nr:hypothetical protein DEO72_LG3g561 [Vigna unguiculata]